MADQRPPEPKDQRRPEPANQRPPQPPNVPDYLLERYALGELPAEQTARIDRQAESDPALRARLDALRASNEEILAAYPAREFARAVERQAQREERTAQRAPAAARGLRGFPRLRWILPAPALVAAILLAVLIARPERFFGTRPGTPPGSESTAEVTRAKGEPQLRIYRRTGEAIDTVRENDMAGEGDVLQVSYVPFGRSYGVILSIDGRGTVTLHYPSAASASTRLGGPGEILLPEAYELDDAPAFERFFLVTSSAPIDVDKIMAAAHDLARTAPPQARTECLAIADSLQQSSFLIQKRGPRQ